MRLRSVVIEANVEASKLPNTMRVLSLLLLAAFVLLVKGEFPTLDAEDGELVLNVQAGKVSLAADYGVASNTYGCCRCCRM